MELPVFLITGFLESGKTSFILDTIQDRQFNRGKKTLIIACEDGEVEYEEKILKSAKAVVEFIEDEDDFNEEYLNSLVAKHKPSQILIEFNGMWSLRNMAVKAPKDWMFYQIFMFMDHSKFEVYMNNMRQLLSDNISIADILVFNRCDKSSIDKKRLRRTTKALNPRIEMMFEYNDGTVEQGFQGDDEMPFDVNADPIDVIHDDFGLWYIDIMSNAPRYKGKNMRVRGMVYRASNIPDGYFVISRRAMTCCADDIAVIGILVKSPEGKNFESGEWVEVCGSVIAEKHDAYKGQGPVIVANTIVPTEKAESELVYFN